MYKPRPYYLLKVLLMIIASATVLIQSMVPGFAAEKDEMELADLLETSVIEDSGEKIEVNSETSITGGAEGSSDIIFDASAVKKRASSYSALSDLHGISVFTNSFIEKEAQYKATQKKKNDQIVTGVLSSESKSGAYETWVNLVLKSEDQRILKEEYRPAVQTSNVWVWLGSILLSISLLSIALIIDDIHKKKKKRLKKNMMNRSHAS